MNRFKEMFKYGNFRKRIVITFIEYMITSIIWIIIDQYMTYSLFDDAIAKENIKLVIFLSILMIVKIITNIAEGILNCILRHHLQRDFSHYARNDIYKKIINSKVEFFDKSNTGELFELLMNDSGNFSTFFTQYGLQTSSYLVKTITYLIILLFVDLKLTAILAISYVIANGALIASNKRTFSIINEIRKLNISITKWITEQVNGYEIIKSMQFEEKRLDKMKELIDTYNNESNKLDKIVRKYIFIYDFFSLLTTLFVVCIGGLDILSGVITYGALMIFVNGTSTIKYFLDVFIRSVNSLNSSYMSFIKILKFNNDFLPENDCGKLSLEKINNIQIENLNFSYNENKQILNNINIEVNSNNKIAIIGKTGSGKTTLVNLLCRFYELKDGTIKINGKDYKKYELSDLREQIGYVMQDVVIFEGNVFENINYANKKVSEEEIINICKKLNLHNKIISLEKGYKTNLNKNKDLLSQGEKQMINFARILVENPSMIILDEVTSSLSYENEELIKNAINEIIKGRICIIIAHRLSTIKSCDKILLMKNGKIIEEGNHTELIERKGEYYELIHS
jgi:ABC-type multidrug transport system fused ATPase/permease subunit